MFFFEKRTKKLLRLAIRVAAARVPRHKSFLLLFFKKEVLAFLLFSSCAAAADRLRCGVITEPLDWNRTDLHGSLVALDTEICRAIATARFGSSDRLEIKAFTSEQQGIEAVHAGQADAVAGVTPDFQQGQKNRVRYSGSFFLDAQGFMVHRNEGVHSLEGIASRKLCFVENSGIGPTALSALAARGIRTIPFPFQEEGEMDAAIMDRHCQVTTAYLTKLAEARSSFPNRAEYVFLPELLAISPVSVATAAADMRLSAIVDATISALLQAEFLQITQRTATTIASGDDPRMQLFLGDDYAAAAALGLPHDWARKVTAAVGNYAEIYARTIGPGTPFGLPRGLNALWNNGGSLVPRPLH